MNNSFYIVALILVVAWAIGFFVYSAGSIIHLLLIIAIIAIILRVIQSKKSCKRNAYIKKDIKQAPGGG